MTKPDTTEAAASGNSDAPTAEVKTLGLSEILGLLAVLSSLLGALFGKDFGISENAQAIAAAGVVLIPMALSIARAIKHHGAASANAAVYIAQLSAVTSALAAPTKANTPKAVAAGVSKLNAPAHAD